MSFTVGQIAKLTGLTVRALHHYHAIGLLERLELPDDRMRELLRVAGEMRNAMAAGEGVDGVCEQTLVAEWESLLDEFSGGDVRRNGSAIHGRA